MGLNITYQPGQTPLDEDEKEGLKIKTITTREELDEFEQKNIEEAIRWTLSQSLRVEQLISESFIRQLHTKMYGQVRVWAGEFRKTNKNIGVDKWQISVELRQLCQDANFWVNKGTFPPDEIAIRFKHRLVSVHCFPNGNGRHSRLVADLIADKLYNDPVFSWGGFSQNKPEVIRSNYLTSLRLADQGDFESLIKFSRS